MIDFPVLVFVVCLATLIVAAWCGDSLRKRSKSSAEAPRDDSGIVLGGTLTVLGLIIGFSFAMATSRYDLRKANEHNEVNTIAVLYMRVDLLSPVDAAKVHTLLKRYTDQRILSYTTRNTSELAKIADDTDKTQNEIWSAIEAGLRTLPPPLQGLFVTGTNDLVASRLSTHAAWSNRLPIAVWMLLLFTSIGASFLIGYRAHRTDWLVFIVIPVVVSISLFLISDLDSPHGGVIHVRPQNLMALSRAFGGQVP